MKTSPKFAKFLELVLLMGNYMNAGSRNEGSMGFEMNYLTKVSYSHQQRAKKVLSDSPGLVDFAIGLVNSVFNLPDGQVMFYEEFE